MNLHPIAPKERQGLGELRLDRGADLNDLTPRENDRVADRFIYVEPLHLRRRFFDVISDPVDDVSGPIDFGHNTVERFPRSPSRTLVASALEPKGYAPAKTIVHGLLILMT